MVGRGPSQESKGQQHFYRGQEKVGNGCSEQKFIGGSDESLKWWWLLIGCRQGHFPVYNQQEIFSVCWRIQATLSGTCVPSPPRPWFPHSICFLNFFILYSSIAGVGIPGGSDSKESTCNAGGPGSVHLVGKRSHGGGHGNPPQCTFYTGESHEPEEESVEL